MQEVIANLLTAGSSEKKVGTNRGTLSHVKECAPFQPYHRYFTGNSRPKSQSDAKN
jgi:hypothetical protein